jgi:putative endonuclease
VTEEKVYSVYIVTNTRRGVLYTGITGDLVSRGRQHRLKEVQGFTRRWGCSTLVWFEWHGDVNEAIRREKLIKRWRRDWKFALIERINPEWCDLWPALMGQVCFPWETEPGVERPGAPELDAPPARYRGGSSKRTAAFPAVPDKPLRVFPG